MAHAFMTRQFRAGNSQAVRIPSEMAFPPKTELVVTRDGNRITIEPLEKPMEDVPALFASLARQTIGTDITHPDFIDAERSW